MNPIDVLEKNLELSNKLPQMLETVTAAAVRRSILVTSSFWFAVFKTSSPELIVKLQNGADPDLALDKESIMREVDRTLKEELPSELFAPAVDTTLDSLSKNIEIIDTQRIISHLSLSSICTSFETYCIEKFLILSGKDKSPSNVSNLKSLYHLFSGHTNCLDLSTYPNLDKFRSCLGRDGVFVEKIDNLFSYRHVIVHKFSIFDTMSVQELNLDTALVGSQIPAFSKEEIREFAQAAHGLGHWLEANI